VTFNPKVFKKDFPLLNEQIIYLDNASTTQKPNKVIDSVIKFYKDSNANVHRGVYPLSENATFQYENSRNIIANFINADKEEIIFTKSTTESINIVANGIIDKLQNGDEIIVSEMEHHSNLVPWIALTKKHNVKLNFIPVLDDGMLDISTLENLITKNTKLISITHMSNVIGVINPIEKIINIAQSYKIKTLIDAAQSISHLSIDVKKLNCDYLVFSGHKIMGPTGVGILYAKKNILNSMPPLLYGGHMIRDVDLKTFSYNEIPWKFEAGTNNIAQAIGLGTAIEYFKKLDQIAIHKHTKNLILYLINGIKTIPNINIYPKTFNEIGPVIAFSINGVHTYDLAKLLGTKNICIRSGHHCAQPLLQRFKIESLCRVSLYFYNTTEDIDIFLKNLKKIIKILSI
tara:strand:+ start:496 stop:1701 length:1206 start_codon:yes stop_codon:yes gene_type:complete